VCFLYVYVDKLPDVWTTFFLEVLLYQEMYEDRSALQAVSYGLSVSQVLYLSTYCGQCLLNRKRDRLRHDSPIPCTYLHSLCYTAHEQNR
jgi:hypothetical protein